MDEALFTYGLKGVFEIAILADSDICRELLQQRKKTKRKTAKKRQ